MDQTDNRIYREPAGQVNHGGPAFPVNDQGVAHLVGAAAIDGVTDSAERDRLYVEARARAVSGMTLRDYFAAQFMVRAQSLCETNSGWNEHNAAQCAYAMADAMLKARAA
jgi:hypothetical protein